MHVRWLYTCMCRRTYVEMRGQKHSPASAVAARLHQVPCLGPSSPPLPVRKLLYSMLHNVTHNNVHSAPGTWCLVTVVMIDTCRRAPACSSAVAPCHGRADPCMFPGRSAVLRPGGPPLPPRLQSPPVPSQGGPLSFQRPSQRGVARLIVTAGPATAPVSTPPHGARF